MRKISPGFRILILLFFLGFIGLARADYALLSQFQTNADDIVIVYNPVNNKMYIPGGASGRLQVVDTVINTTTPITIPIAAFNVAVDKRNPGSGQFAMRYRGVNRGRRR